MFRNITVTRVTLWVTRLIGGILLVLLPVFPFILNWYAELRFLAPSGKTALIAAFYCCAVIALAALWFMDCLLRAIFAEQVFTRKNVSYIRWIRWCCALISLICLPAAFFYPPLIFVVAIMAFLALTVTVLVRVMNAAVEIREENDLTI